MNFLCLERFSRYNAKRCSKKGEKSRKTIKFRPIFGTKVYIFFSQQRKKIEKRALLRDVDFDFEQNKTFPACQREKLELKCARNVRTLGPCACACVMVKIIQTGTDLSSNFSRRQAGQVLFCSKSNSTSRRRALFSNFFLCCEKNILLCQKWDEI